jgi:hypothetical protein
MNRLVEAGRESERGEESFLFSSSSSPSSEERRAKRGKKMTLKVFFFSDVEEKKKITSQRLSLSLSKKERDFSLISSSLQLTTPASTQLTSHRIAIHCRDADTQARDRGRRLGARDEVPGRRRRIVCSVAEGGRRRRRDEPRRGQQRPWPNEHAWLAHEQSLGRHVPRQRGNGEGKERESPTF